MWALARVPPPPPLGMSMLTDSTVFFFEAFPKRVWLLKTQEVEAEKKQSTQNNQPLTEDEMMCDHCEEEFTSKKLHREHTHSCPICIVTFKQYLYCLLDHMRSNHEELYCENCNKCFTTSTK